MYYSGEQFKVRWWIFVFFLITAARGYPQAGHVRGSVKDAATGQPIRDVSVYIPGGRGRTTDSTGHFDLVNEKPIKQLIFSLVGYRRLVQNLNPDKDSVVNVELYTTENDLNNVVVSTKKHARYHNKDNPAVELIRKVIENKDKNRPEHYDFVEYEQYEKLQVSLSKISEKIKNSKMLRKYQFLFDNVDSTKIEGKTLIPVYIEEKLSNNYYRKSPEKKKVFVTADKKVDYGEFIDNSGVSSYLNRLYENIDIYDNNIPVFTNQFLSPIAGIAPTFYMFYIRDTVTDESTGKKLVKMYFTPRNTNDMLFRGTMFITLDGNYAVQKLDMFISKNVNLNFVREMHINQEFEKNPDGRYHLSKSDMVAEAGITKGKGGGLYGERSVSFKNYKINQPHDDKFYEGAQEIVAENAGEHQDSFWVSHRHDSLTTAESRVYKNIDSLQKMPSFRRLMDLATLIIAGYKSFNKFEIGPANAFYSFNPVEGFRLRFGGRTTPNLSKRLYFETYAAYGFKDQKWKGYLGVTYSLNNKSIYSYPLNFIRASVQRETKIPGQELQFVQEDNFLLSFKRGNNDKWLYNDFAKIDYVHEFANHFSYTLGYKYWKQTPAGAIQYVKSGDNSVVNSLTTSEVSLELRWAPHEQFYQGKVYRLPIINKYPIITLRFDAGIKGLFNGEYNYQNLGLRLEKRVYMSQLGYSDIVIEGNNTFGQVPYPLMSIHRANQTYAYQLNSYNLMNFLEFVSDHYAGIMIDHHFQGLFFNKIPLLKRLKLREVLSAKILYGGVRDENNPAKHPELYKFPTDINGMPTTFTLNKTPYIEGSVGVANIFKVIRVDLVKRFTYLNNPDISTWGIRARYKFDF